jgi:Xaa-Pro aminopeptidase
MATPFDTGLSGHLRDTDEQEFRRLLETAGNGLRLSEPSPALARDLLAGVVAAPAPWQGDEGWMPLIVDRPSPQLANALAVLKARLAASQPRIEPGDRDTAAARLDALRGRMTTGGLAAFVVPLSDPHQLENPPANAQRLRWLTGFTGSAGVAVVLAEEAAVFVDGRYTLQVQHEVDAALYHHHHVTERPPADWIAANVSAGARVGYDPWMMTEDDVARYVAALGRVGASLVPVEPNPIDVVWADRPPAPISRVWIHDARFAGASSEEKRGAIAATLAAQGIATAVLTLPDSICWLLNVRGGDVACSPLMLAFALLHSDGRVDLFVDARKLTPEVGAHVGSAVTVHAPSAFAGALERLGARGAAVLVDPASAPAAVFGRLGAAKITRGADPCQLPKACKSAVEVRGMHTAHERDGVAMVRFLAWLEGAVATGIDELGVAENLLRFRAEGEYFRGLSFPTIAGAGPNGAIVHYHSSPATNRTLTPGDVFLLDSGAQYWDGTTDVTRTLAVPGAVPPREAREAFTRVLKGHIALARARFPEGTSGSQLDALARVPLWDVGLDYDHGTGHGVGHYLGVHEGPQRISKVPNRIALRPGMVVSIEPGYYRTGGFGIRIENLATVVPTGPGERRMLGFEALTVVPIDRAMVVPELLTPEESTWLDAYHKSVRERLVGRLDATAAAWLERATQPIGV